MKDPVGRWQTGGFLFTAVVGTGLHFLFDLTGGNVLAALISAVNESIWEHLKLLFYPMLIFSLFQYRKWGRDRYDFWCVKLRGTLLGLILIPVLYYSYTGILGVKADWFNITIFFLVAGFVYLWETRQFKKGISCPRPDLAIAGFVVITLLFTLLTFLPPQIPLFRDPLTGTYGFQ